MSKRALQAKELCHFAFDQLNRTHLIDMCKDLALHKLSDPDYHHLAGRLAADIIMGTWGGGHTDSGIQGLLDMITSDEESDKEMYRTRVVDLCDGDDSYIIINIHLMKHGIDTSDWTGSNPDITWYVGGSEYRGPDLTASLRSALSNYRGKDITGASIMSGADFLSSVRLIPNNVGLEVVHMTPQLLSGRTIAAEPELTARIFPYDTLAGLGDISSFIAADIAAHFNRVKWESQSAGDVD